MVDAGELESLRGWKNLNDHNEANVQTRMAGTLVAILNWSFSADVQARMELLEREILNYQKRSGEEVSHAMRSPCPFFHVLELHGALLLWEAPWQLYIYVIA